MEDMEFDAVIFDNDNTLIDSWQAIVRAATRWAEEFDVPHQPERDFHGMSTEAIIRELLAGSDEQLIVRAIARMEEIEVEEVDGIVPVAGAADMLAELTGARMAVATSGTTPVATARLKAAGLPIPAVLVTADDVTHAKPDPEVFLLAAQRLGINPARTLVVEDALAGVQAGRAAGATVLAVATTTTRDALTDAGADMVVADFTQLSLRVEDGKVLLGLAG